MQSLYLVRTATVVSLGALFLGVGWMEMQADAMRVAPEMVAVSSALAEPAVYFPAGFQLQPNADQPEVYEYY
jgi:hypothetical protein